MADLIGQRLGQYEITALLGEGGMAAVYRARQKSMARDVAIKIVESKLARNPEFVKRFEREARVIASLSHAHILKVFESGRQGDLLYLVMELLTGGSLADRIRREQLTAVQAEQMLEQLASALDYAHQKGIIHRDLKPQNVLLDEAGNALLTDFGIAKLLDESTSLTQSGTSMGTPSYMSPEQWQGAALDGRSDVYALGVMLFEMLSGRLPFQGETPFSMMNMHVYQSPPSIREFRPDVPPSVDKVLGKALAKNREHRFQTAGEMAGAFTIALRGVTPPGVELPASALRSTPPAVQTADLTAPQPARRDARTSQTPTASAEQAIGVVGGRGAWVDRRDWHCGGQSGVE